MKFLITGGAGFIGSHLALYLYERDHHITIIDDFSTGNNFYLHNYEIITGNINNLEFIDKVNNYPTVNFAESIFKSLKKKRL